VFVILHSSFRHRCDLYSFPTRRSSDLLEIGLVGTLALIILLSWFLYKGKYYKDDTLVLFVLGLSYMFLTESVFETSKPMYVICFLFLVIMIQVPYKMKKVI